MGPLLQLLIGGDAQAFEEIYRRYHARVYAFILSFTKDAAMSKALQALRAQLGQFMNWLL